MLDIQHQEAIKASEPFAPKRLTRGDVGALRQFYADAWSVFAADRQRTYKRTLVLYLNRQKSKRALGRLGIALPRCEVVGRWDYYKEWGLDVEVHAIAVTVANIQKSIKVGKHRFRNETSQKQFCREVSRLVRLGLGWSKRHSRRNTNWEGR